MWIKKLFNKKENNEMPMETNVDRKKEYVNKQPDFVALKEFCSLILCAHNEGVYQRCKHHIQNETGEFDGIESVLYVLSGHDDDSYENQKEKQFVQPQYYLISSDAGAPCLSDFFSFIEDGIMEARGLKFQINKEKFSDDDCIVEWLAELSVQLKDLYIILFDGGSDDYHFTIMNKDDCERAMELYSRISVHSTTYEYSTMIIGEDFKG